jgi:acylphosphatase
MQDSILRLGCDTELLVVCKKCLVGGRVQGVFYRGTAVHRARALGVRGYAKNLVDGRVEVLACGDQAAVLKFVAWLWVGSSASHVKSVEVSDIECDPDALPREFAAA